MARPILPPGQKKERVPLYVKPENVQAVKDFAAGLDAQERPEGKHHPRCTCMICNPGQKPKKAKK